MKKPFFLLISTFIVFLLFSSIVKAGHWEICDSNNYCGSVSCCGTVYYCYASGWTTQELTCDPYLSNGYCYYNGHCDSSTGNCGYSNVSCPSHQADGDICYYNAQCTNSGCSYLSSDTNKQCDQSVCTDSGWNNSNCICHSDSDCDDDNPCTTDKCVNGKCEYTNVADGTITNGGVCCDGILYSGGNCCSNYDCPGTDSSCYCSNHQCVPCSSGYTCSNHQCVSEGCAKKGEDCSNKNCCSYYRDGETCYYNGKCITIFYSSGEKEKYCGFDSCSLSDYCSGNIRYYNGQCTSTGCTFDTENCNDHDDWYDTGVTRWVDDPNNPCKEKEQKKQEYRDYTCCDGTCNCYTVTDTQWVDTGRTRNKPDGTDCGDCKVCSSGQCVEKTKPTCGECQSGPYCDASTDTWYCTNKGLCTECSSGYCDGNGNCVENPCGICKYCSNGQCVNRPDGYNDCGAGCQRCVNGQCQDYNPACDGMDSSCYCENDKCVSCQNSGCCDATCNNYQCGLTPNNNNCPSGQYCDSDCTCKNNCSIGSVCKTDPWSCKGPCERTRAIYVYDSSCNCVYDHNETEYAPQGKHCSNGDWTAAGYCGSSTKYCSDDRYVKIDRYECDGSGNCNYYDYSETLSDCGATYYDCKDSCTKTYHYTCSNGQCGSYSKDYYCPEDTACKDGSCSADNYCSISGYQCKDSCTKAKAEYRCDGSGNCNQFWQWVDITTCNPFSCSNGACGSVCSATCGADSACDGKQPGDFCGTGKTCDSNCKCVVTSCADYTDKTSCNADPNCAWCSGDNTCKDASAVECQPPACSPDGHSKCSSSCTWVDCGSTDDSCYCSNGQCVVCSGDTPKCNNYQCGCWQDTDCNPYEICPTSSSITVCSETVTVEPNVCFDFRSYLTGTCCYYDYCTSSECATNPDYCYNADAGLCGDASSMAHGWFGCPTAG